MKRYASQRQIFVLGYPSALQRRLSELFASRGDEVATYSSRSDLISAANARSPDLVIICVTTGEGFDVSLGVTLANVLSVPFAVVTDSWDDPSANLATENGALVYLAGTEANAWQCICVISAALTREAELRDLHRRVEQITGALQQARTISTATGVVMERMHLGRQRAFDALRAAARARRSRLSDYSEVLLQALESLNGLHSDVPGR